MINNNKLIFFIAAFDPTGFKLTRFLAANKKMQFMLNVLTTINYKVVLICSTPNLKVKNSIRVVDMELENKTIIKVIIPASKLETIKWNMVLNILQIPSILKFAVNNFGQPNAVWTYNAYIFEMISARYLSKKYNSYTILEFEDWHFSRGVSIKSILDWFYWKKALRYIDFSFCVNQFLQNKMKKFGIRNELLPGTVDKNIVFKGTQKNPFRNKSNVIKCGYFGGLTKDKGADFLIQLINKSIDQNLSIKWYITGAGPFKTNIENLSKNNPNFVEYLGVVSDSELAEIVSNTDILLNPHIKMNGVFPFKLIEYAASGRLILSSDILFPSQYNWIQKAILFEILDIEKWLSIIIKSSNIFLERKNNIDYAKKRISIEFSKSEIRNKILELL